MLAVGVKLEGECRFLRWEEHQAVEAWQEVGGSIGAQCREWKIWSGVVDRGLRGLGNGG